MAIAEYVAAQEACQKLRLEKEAIEKKFRKAKQTVVELQAEAEAEAAHAAIDEKLAAIKGKREK